MTTITKRKIEATSAYILAGGLLLLSANCAHKAETAKNPDPTVGPALVAPSSPAATKPEDAVKPPDAPGEGQLTFASDADAAKAILAAAKAQDMDQMHHLLGPAWKDLVSGDKVEDANALKEFAAHADEHLKVDPKQPAISVIEIGKDEWPFPIPIVKTADGKWFFDTVAGKDEILARRIGANELSTIDVCRAYCRAQWLYQHKDRDGSGVIKFAQRLISTPGNKDGLYWPAQPGEEQSPFGPLIAEAQIEGYAPPPAEKPHSPYHGYRFRILKQQGADAPGGAYSYVINGNMVAGFALVAFPEEYGSSGIMTFIVNQNGNVYQKDLGSDTKSLAWHMTDYNPDSSWTLVQE